MNRKNPEKALQDMRRGCYIARLRLKTVYKKLRRTLTPSMMDQLDQCRDDDARRLLMGIGKR